MIHTVQTDGRLPEHYMPPVVGNGDLILMLDDKGAQASTIPGITERNSWVRPRIWLSGRRYAHRYRDMVTYGHIEATPILSGRDADSDKRNSWQQTLSVRSGMVDTIIEYDGFSEHTNTFVLMDRNLLIIHKEFVGDGDLPDSVRFRYIWHTGDSHDDFPRLTNWEAECVDSESPCVDIGYSIFGVGEYLGRTLLFSDSAGTSHVYDNLFEVEARVDPATRSVTGYLFFADSLDADWDERASEAIAWCRSIGYEGLEEKQKADWGEFWSRTHLRLPEEHSDVQGVWETSLYHCRVGITRWSVGPGFGNRLWAGRYFHDELFPFHALASSNQLDLAGRIPRFRRSTLDAAMSRTGGKGARWGWETTEDGFEGIGNICVSLYEVWHMGSIAQEAWEYYRYTGDMDVLAEISYPIIRGCAEYYRRWVIMDIGDGRVVSVPCMDLDEGLSPVTSGLCTMMAAEYSMRHAAIASELLGVDESERSEWLRLADLVKANAPNDGVTYLPYSGAEEVTLAVIASVFPFMMGGIDNPLAAESVRTFHRVCRKSISWAPEARYNMDWTWTSGWLAASAARLGWADMAGDAIVRATHTTMTFGSVPEHVEHHEDGIKYVLAWFTTGAGAFVAGMNELFLQSWSDDIRIACGVPESWRDFAFKLLAKDQTVVEVSASDGRLQTLSLTCSLPGRITHRLRIPSRLISGTPEVSGGEAAFLPGEDSAELRVSYEGRLEMRF